MNRVRTAPARLTLTQAQLRHQSALQHLARTFGWSYTWARGDYGQTIATITHETGPIITSVCTPAALEAEVTPPGGRPSARITVNLQDAPGADKRRISPRQAKRIIST